MGFLKDLRVAGRTLGKRPGLLTVAILSMALGIGANTAIVSLIDAVLWQALPVEDPEKLVLLDYEMQPGVRMGMHNGWSTSTPEGSRISTSFKYPSFQRFQQQDLFQELFAFAPLYRSNFSVRNGSEMVQGQLVSGNYFAGLGLDPYLGRLIDPGDDQLDAPGALVLHYDYWQSRFGGDPSLIGEVVQVNQHSFTVVGIAPPGFQGTLQIGTEAQIYVPIATGYDLSPFSAPLSHEDYWWVRIMGRPQPGVSRSTIEGTLSNLVTANLTTPPNLDPDHEAEFPVHVRLQDGSQGLQEQRAELRTPLFAVSAVAGLVLLLCCANVAGLLVARGAGRQREMAVRLSLGATRWRLIRQQLIESTLIAGAGALVGLLVALLLQGLLAAQFASQGLDVLQLDLALNWRVLSITGVVALATGLLFGLAPALKCSAVNLVSGLKEGTIGSTTSRSRLWLGRLLVGCQVALSVLVLGTAGLFLGTLQNLRSVDVGFDPENVLLFRVDPRLSGYEHEEQMRLQQQLRERLSAIPGVRAVTTMDFSPVGSAGSSTSGLRLEGIEGEHRTDIVTTAHNFFETLNVPIQVGRSFAMTDTAGSPRVAIVSAELARRYLGEESPIGRRLTFSEEGGFEIEIVGVAADIKNRTLRQPLGPVVYLPESQSERMFYATFALRTAADPNVVVPQLREAVQEIDPQLPVFDLKLYRDQIAQAFHSELQFARLTSIFGLVGLALACIGLYGILSHAVAQRTREFGIRIALGAGRSRLVGLVMKEVYLVAAGVIAGLLLSFFATQAVESLLFGLSPIDPVALGGAALVMFLAGCLAAYLPARRASATDPLPALRAE